MQQGDGGRSGLWGREGSTGGREGREKGAGEGGCLGAGDAQWGQEGGRNGRGMGERGRWVCQGRNWASRRKGDPGLPAAFRRKRIQGGIEGVPQGKRGRLGGRAWHSGKGRVPLREKETT